MTYAAVSYYYEKVWTGANNIYSCEKCFAYNISIHVKQVFIGTINLTFSLTYKTNVVCLVISGEFRPTSCIK